MKYRPVTYLCLVVSFAAFGGCTTVDNRVDETAAIREALFRYQMARCHADTYFLAVEPTNSDPSKAFMRRFANHEPPVEKNSASRYVKGEGLFDKKTGKRGIMFAITGVKWLSDTKVEAAGGHYSGELGGAWYLYTMKKEQGKWTVIYETLDVVF